jgi:hypothetical protein
MVERRREEVKSWRVVEPEADGEEEEEVRMTSERGAMLGRERRSTLSWVKRARRWGLRSKSPWDCEPWFRLPSDDHQ